MSSIEMSSIEDVLRETISKLCLNRNIKPEDLTRLIDELTRVIEYRKNEELYYKNQLVNEESTGESNVVESKAVENKKEEFPIMESPTTVTVKPSFSQILKKDLPPSTLVDTSSNIVSSNSVTSTNSSRNSEPKTIIRGIAEGNENEDNESINHMFEKNKIINNIDDFINSMVENGFPMWRIIYYLYISNKEIDKSASTSTEDARHNDMKYQIFEAYTSNKLINFNEKHSYYEFMEYYFKKIIKYEEKDKKYVINKLDVKGTPINLFLKKRFLRQINERLKKSDN